MPVLPEQLTIFAPAKVNLHLAVLDRRPDGFHNLESVFLAVDFGDTLHYELINGENTPEIIMEAPSTVGAARFNLPVEKNIIFKAMSLFREKTGFTQGLRVRVEKRIPLGGGLGGGSSNAAATLLVMNKLAGGLLGRDALLKMAASLGSDVPFFIYETAAALVTGRGECVKPIEAPHCFLVLVNPGFPSDTAAAFRLLVESRKGSGDRGSGIRDFFQTQMKDNSSIPLFVNDFLPVFPEREKFVYNQILSDLRELGAGFAGLSGAGSTCFGVFEEKKLAEKAAVVLRTKWGFAECCSPSKNSLCEDNILYSE